VEQGKGIPMKELVRGGFYGVDIKQQSDGTYNVHLHVLCDMAYIPQPALSEVWNDVAGAPVLDVRRCYSSEKDALLEVIGYATKPPEFENVEDAVSVVSGLKGSCLVQPFGDLYGDNQHVHRLVCPNCEEVPEWWEVLGYIDVPRTPDESGSCNTAGDRPPPED
jgi:hypothetical protein